MPVIVTDPHSGGLVFNLTPEELEVKGIKDNLTSLTKELEDKISVLDDIINDQTKKKKK